MRWALVLLVLLVVLVLILILVLILFILLLLLLRLSGDDVALSDRVPRFWSDRNGNLSRF
jgi:hypothetical protein